MISNTSKCRYYNLSRALPTTVGDFIQIGQYVAGDYSGMGIRMTINCYSDANTISQSKIYEIALKYNATAAAYQKLVPVESSAAGTPTFQVEISVSNDTATFRIVRLSGVTAATCEVSFEFRDYDRFLVGNLNRFTELSATGATGGVATTLYVPSSLLLSGETAKEIDALTAKVTPTTSDELLIEDAADSFKKKKIAISALPAAAPAVHAASHAFGATDVTGIQTAATNSSHYTGFPNRTDSSIAFDDGTITFSLTGTFDVYQKSVKYTPAAGQKSIPITNVTGLYFVWYTFPLGVPTLNQSTIFPGFDTCLVATVYWNAATAKGRLSDERHAVGRDPLIHEYLHKTVGMRYGTGLDAAFTNTTFAINPGEVYDEELAYVISPAKTVIDVLYKSGSAAWVWDAANVTPYKLNGNAIRYNNGTALADVNSGNYVAYWVFATASLVKPFISIMGQRVDTNLNNCRNNATPASLSLGSLPSAEMKLLYRVIYHQSGVNVVFDEITDYRAGQVTTVSGLVVADHAGLTNLGYNVANHTGFFTLTPDEFAPLTLENSPTSSDVLLLEDASSAGAKRRLPLQYLAETPRFAQQDLILFSKDLMSRDAFPCIVESVSAGESLSLTAMRMPYNAGANGMHIIPIPSSFWDMDVVDLDIFIFSLTVPSDVNHKDVILSAKIWVEPVTTGIDFDFDPTLADQSVTVAISAKNTIYKAAFTGLPINRTTATALTTSGVFFIKFYRDYFSNSDTFKDNSASVYCPFVTLRYSLSSTF